MTEPNKHPIEVAIDAYNKLADRVGKCNVTGAYSNIAAFATDFAELGLWLCSAFNYSGETGTLYASVDEDTKRIRFD